MQTSQMEKVQSNACMQCECVVVVVVGPTSLYVFGVSFSRGRVDLTIDSKPTMRYAVSLISAVFSEAG